MTNYKFVAITWEYVRIVAVSVEMVGKAASCADK
jgi:hypothetical protein